MYLRRARLTLLATLLALSFALAACGGSSTVSDSGPVTIRIADTPSFIYIGGYAAAELGYFKDEGITIKRISTAGAAEATTALLAGSVDAVFNTVDALPPLAAKGQKLQAVVGLQSTPTFKLVLSDSAAAKYAGKDPSAFRNSHIKLGVTTPGSGSDLGLRALLRAYGVDPDKDVSIVATHGAGPMVAALKAGSIDGFFNSEPSPAAAVDQGIGKVFLSYGAGQGPKDLRDVAFSAVVMSSSFISKHPDVVARIVRAVAKAEAALRADPKAVIKVAQAYIDKSLTPAVINKVSRTDAKFWVPAIQRAAVANMVSQLKQDGQIKQDANVPYDQVVATQFEKDWTPS